MDSELELLSWHLMSASSTKDVFGTLSGTSAEMHAKAKAIYRQLARSTHPDRYSDDREKGIAEGAFVRLAKLWEAAQAEIKNGTYGKTHVSFTSATLRIKTRRSEYAVGGLMFQGDVCNLYHATILVSGAEAEAIIKIARRPSDNDLVQSEARVLTHLYQDKDNEKYRTFLPSLIEPFIYKEEGTGIRRAGNAFSPVAGLRPLTDVVKHYPMGVDPRDMAWIWRRLLTALGLANASNVVHGAVFPEHVLIQPEQHGLVLVDWCYSLIDPVNSGQHIRAMVPTYKAWYSKEVLNGTPPLPGLDIYLGAKCMVQIMGGDPVSGRLPVSVPAPLQAFFKGCMSPEPRRRPQDAWRLLEEFDALLVRLYGPRKFRPFSLPS